MAIADKLTTIAELTPTVYEKGKFDEYSTFWDGLPKTTEVEYSTTMRLVVEQELIRLCRNIV